MPAALGRQLAALGREYSRLSRLERGGLLGGALLGALVAAALGLSPVAGSLGELRWWLGVAAAASWGFWSSWIVFADVKYQRIPNAVLVGAAVSVGVLAGGALLAQGEPGRLLVALVSAGCALALGIASWAALPGVLGAGDAKLFPLAVFVAALPGLAGVWTAFLGVMLLGLLLGGVTALVRGRREFTLGPVLIAASWLGAAVGSVLG